MVSDFRPSAASILNITPDHLARHGTLEEYKRCKLKLFEHQTAEDRAVLPLVPRTIHPHTHAAKRYFGNVNDRKDEPGCFTSPKGIHWVGEQEEWSLQKGRNPTAR